MITCRTYVQKDYQFLREMLYEAVFWSRAKDDRPQLEEGLSYDYTKHILENFGCRKGDLAVIAEINGKQVGAAFIRYWDDDINTRGYVSENIPVLVIGVVEAYRRQGIASVLMESIKTLAIDNGISKISLCVTKNNIAYNLYVKHKYEIIDETESSYNMVWTM